MHYYSKKNRKKSWKKMDLMVQRNCLPPVPCCYAIYFDGVLKYIGSTNNLRNRFSEHSIRYGYAKDIITPWIDVDDETKIEIKFKPSSKYGDWLMLEARLIMRLKPIFNKKMKGGSILSGGA